jgi:hypothetical protein
MLKVIWRVFCLAALTLIALGSVASAQDTVRIRGTIEKVDGAVYVVKSRDGSELKDSLTDNPLCRNLTAARRRSRSTSFPNRCAAPAKGAMRGICNRRAP